MSPSPAQEEPTHEPPAVVFARLTDVPLDVLEKLIETTEGAYADLNRVYGHPYWGDLVLHQGAALRAMREARDCLDAFRAEATGARNSELGITVATAVIDNERHFAETENDKRALVDRVLRPPNPACASHLYVWDRPYLDEQIAGPYTQMRIVVDPERELGVLNFTEESEDGELRSWQTRNPTPPPDQPPFRFDAGSPLTFPRDSVCPFGLLRRALTEFSEEGSRPEAVQWQQARWGQP